MIQVLAAVPLWRQKLPPVSPSFTGFSFPFSPQNLSVCPCKRSSASSCTHLTPHPSDKAHSACRVGGQQAKGSCFSDTLHHNGLPAFSEPPSILCDLTPSGFNGLRGAVDGAWEYLLFSCFCQPFGLKTTQNSQRCTVCKRRGGLTSVCDGAVLPLFNMQAACAGCVRAFRRAPN